MNKTTNMRTMVKEKTLLRAKNYSVWFTKLGNKESSFTYDSFSSNKYSKLATSQSIMYNAKTTILILMH